MTSPDLRARAASLLAIVEGMTPRPWRLHGYAADVCPSDEVADTLPDDASDFIATCNMSHNRLTGGTEQEFTNARGIVALANDAAPLIADLLAALREGPVGMEEIERLVDEAIRAQVSASLSASNSFSVDDPVEQAEFAREFEDAAKVRTALLDAVRDALGAMTVGAALALPQVQRGEVVVEYRVDGDRTQIKVDEDGSLDGRWPDNDNEDERGWDHAYVTPRDMALPCRLVPIADADRNPDERGPLSGERSGR